MDIMFGKKESIFDQNQNRQLKALVKNQKILVENNNDFIKQHKNLWSWINYLKQNRDNLLKRVANLEATIVNMKETDRQFAETFQNLAALSQSKAEATEEP